MRDIEPYGVVQNADTDMVTANALVGKPVGSTSAYGSVEATSAWMSYSTAPYRKGPKVNPPLKRTESARYRDNHLLCRARNNTCGLWSITGTDYCRWHS